MFTIVLSFACAVGTGCDYEEHKIVDFHNPRVASSMCSALSRMLMSELTAKDKEREPLFRCLDSDDPKNAGRKLYVDRSNETDMLIELCPYDERSGRFKKQGSPECNVESVATFYGSNASTLCANRAARIEPMYTFSYDIRALDGHLSCLTVGPGSESDAL